MNKTSSSASFVGAVDPRPTQTNPLSSILPKKSTTEMVQSISLATIPSMIFPTNWAMGLGIITSMYI